MGSWNATCGFSQQSISAGEDVYAFLICCNETSKDSVYADGIAKQMGFPIEAQYNDYGSIQNPKVGYATKTTIGLFNEYYKIGKLLIDNNMWKDIESNKKNKSSWDGYVTGLTKEDGFSDVETIFYGIERGYISLRLKTWGNKTIDHNLSFMLIKKDVLESAWETIEYSNEFETEDQTFDKFRDDMEMMITYCFAHNPDNEVRLQEIEQEIEEINKKYVVETSKSDNIEEIINKELNIKKSTEDEQQLSKLYRELTRLDCLDKPWGSDNVESNVSDYGNVCRLFTSSNSVHRESFEYIYNVSKEIYCTEIKSDMIDSLVKFLMTNASFQAFRKIWYPQGHTSQFDTFDLEIEYMERLLRKMYMIRKQRLKDGFYEDGIPEVLGGISIFEEGRIICNNL